MTKTRIYAALILGIFTAAVASEGAGAKSHKKAPPTTGTEGLLYAAGACDLPTLKTIIASGVDVSATDADGYDALSRASINRDDGLRSRTRWKLNCPAAVIALTQAGANPWKARFYQNPRLEENRPEMIAVIRVEDNRENKGKSEKLVDSLKDGVEFQLQKTGEYHLGYPIVGVSEVRQKLLAADFSAEDAMAPDRVKACKALGVDSVFEASLENYRSRSAGIVSAAGMRMKFILSDCKTGELLWQSDQDYTLAEGWIISTFGGNKVRQIIIGSLDGNPALGFPKYKEGKK